MDGVTLDTGISANCVDVVPWFTVNYDDQTAKTSIRILFGFVYVNILILGLLGNILVICSVWRHRTLQTVRNLFIVSLSCSDIVVCLTSLPITPLTFMMKNWLFGSFLCYAFPLFQGMSVCISTFTLTAVAVDRYILIVFPTHRPIQRGQAASMILSIWALAAGVSVPMVVHYNHLYGPDKAMDVQPASDKANYVTRISNETAPGIENQQLPIFCGYFCEEVWPSSQIRQLYGSFVMVLQFVIPMTVISFCYIHICVRLSARNGTRRMSSGNTNIAIHSPARAALSRISNLDISLGLNASSTTPTAISSPSTAERRRRAVLKRQKRTNRMLIAMVVIFGLCWAPQVLMNILRDLESLPSFVNDQMYFYYLICHSIAMTSTIWNPILYSWMNEAFRRAFMELLPCFRKLQRRWSSRTRRKIKCGISATLHDLGSQIDPAATNMEQYASLVTSDTIDQMMRRSSASIRMKKGRTLAPMLSDLAERKPLLKSVTSIKSRFIVSPKSGGLESDKARGGEDKSKDSLTKL